jgi:glycerol-1-phosphate dehydrogenase [NAD(P)+]
VFLLSDTNTYAACGRAAADVLGQKVAVNLCLQSEGPVIPNEETIAYIESAFAEDIDLMIGVGSGVINDLCKHISFKRNLPYYIVATAPSMDGYASVGAALILQGMKITLNARPPKAILADTGVLKDAPFDMIQAGYGDIVGKFSCLNDWELSALINDEYFCKAVFDLTYNTAVQVKGLANGIAARQEQAVG